MKCSGIVVLTTVLVSVVYSAAGLKCYSCMGYDSSIAEDPKTNNKNCEVGSFDSSSVPTDELTVDAFCYTVSTSATQVNNGIPLTARGVGQKNRSRTLDDMVDDRLRENRLTIMFCDADLCNSASQHASQGLVGTLLLSSLLYKLLG